MDKYPDMLSSDGFLTDAEWEALEKCNKTGSRVPGISSNSPWYLDGINSANFWTTYHRNPFATSRWRDATEGEDVGDQDFIAFFHVVHDMPTGVRSIEQGVVLRFRGVQYYNKVGAKYCTATTNAIFGGGGSLYRLLLPFEGGIHRAPKSGQGEKM